MLGAKTIARAKINLFLKVGRRRQDGYHEVKSVMQSLALADELYFRRIEGPGARVNLRCNDPGVPCNEDNLIIKAVEAFERHAQVLGDSGVEVLLNKRIPIGAGLGGGSADAAATILAMNEMFELEMPVDTMMSIGAGIGSDVPFCIKGGTALAEGRGEEIINLDHLPPFQVVLAADDKEVSTRDVYDRFDELLAEGTAEADSEIDEAFDRLMKGIERHEFTNIYPNLRNSLESATIASCQVAEYKELALRAGAVTAMMTGSGSTVFALVSSMESAAEVAWELGKAAPITIITSFADKGAEVVS